jgi:hypothetical protein
MFPGLKKVIGYRRFFESDGFYACHSGQFQVSAYYAQETLDVNLLERRLSKSFVKQVSSGEAKHDLGGSGQRSHYARDCVMPRKI